MGKRKNSSAVAREKYDILKEKAQHWYRNSQVLKEKNETFAKINDELEKENADLVTSLEKSNSEIKRWKNYSDNLPDSGLVEELETENKNCRKTIRSLQKDLKDLTEKYTSKIASLERDIMLKDGKILQLEEVQKDLKERYKELKDDYREQQRWVRGGGNSEK